jgi:hypothetical protein
MSYKMRKKSTKELFNRDLSKLRAIATRQAMYYIFKEQNKDIYFETDGRKRRSKKYKAALKFKGKNKARDYHAAARKIYSAWKYIGIDCFEAGKIYQSILDEKLQKLRQQDLNLKLEGHELEWESLVLYTPESKCYLDIKKDKFAANLHGVTIDAAA